MKKRFFAAVLCAALVFIFAPCAAFAGGTYDSLTVAGGTDPADYTYDAGTGTLTVKTGTTLTLSGSCTHIVVNNGVSANIILNNLTVNTSSLGCAFGMRGATVMLTLQGSNSLTSGTGYPGLECLRNAYLTIQGTGSLTAKGGNNSAGIGSALGNSCGDITINSGTIHATGGNNAAGIGSGAYPSPDGSITITGGTVTGTGGIGGAGIGGGVDAHNISVSISGGTVFAESGGSHAQDIRDGVANSFNTLSISGTAAVFLKNNLCPTPTTAAHTPVSITGHTAGEKAYGISVPWDGAFGAYLVPRTLTYDANGGSGTAPAPVTQHIGTSVALANQGGLTKTGFTLTGWNTAANGSGTSYAVGDTFALAGDATLYAIWTANPQPTPTPAASTGNTVPPANLGLPASLTLHVGGRAQLTPTVDGGNWTVDPQYLSSHHSVFTVTALKPGNTVIRYSLGWEDTEIPVTILPSSMPQTGQDFLPVIVMLILAGSAALGALVYKKKKAKIE